VKELVVFEGLTTQGSATEEQQQLKDHDVEDKADEEYLPPGDTVDEKMYRDADEVENFGAEAPFPTGMLRALLEHLGITTAPRYRIKGVPCLGRVEFKAIIEIFLGPRVLCRHKDQLSEHHAATLWLTPPGRPSPHGSIAARVGCRTLSTTSCPIERRINSRPMG
jgi:hypothetical protein